MQINTKFLNYKKTIYYNNLKHTIYRVKKLIINNNKICKVKKI